MSIIDYCRRKTKLRLMNGEHVHWVEHKTKKNYIRQCVLSFPLWAKEKDFQHLLDEARLLEKKTGVKHSLDHIIPINHPYVSGLSVPWNLQVRTMHHNNCKGNSWHPDQTDLFEEFSCQK